ncbi:MAG: hypothetical protein R3C30_07480 [Hyphomonadaceae bacterium]
MTAETIGTFLSPGTKVRYDGLVDRGPEFGIVIHCWIDPDHDFYDCHIAFYGDALPEGAPREKPYVLRYASTSLVVLD